VNRQQHNAEQAIEAGWLFLGRARQPSVGSIGACLVLFVVVWTSVDAILNAPTAIHGDMAEAYVWGREFQLGYYKHPPFWAWIAGAWFQVLPASDWSFELLCVVNAAVGLIGSWALIGNFSTGPKRIAATVLLIATPYYTLLSLKYNANTIFLSVWPWALHFFVRSLNDRRAGDSVGFGALLAIAVLSKYYAVVLALTCLLAATFHPARRKYLASSAPYISAAVGILLLAPHVWWLFSTGFLPFHYVGHESGRSLTAVSNYALTLVAVAALYQLGVVGVIAWSARRSFFAERGGEPRSWSDPMLHFMVALAVCPLLLTVIFGVLLQLKISINMVVGVFSLVPLLLIDIIGVRQMAALSRLSVRVAACALLGALVLAPIITYANMSLARDVNIRQPRKELAAEATRVWRQYTGRPLTYVAGSDLYADAICFYSPDHPHAFIAFDQRRSPWITAEDLARDGFLAACVIGDQVCLDAAARLSTPGTRRIEIVVSRSRRGHALSSQAFTLVLIAPTHHRIMFAPAGPAVEEQFSG
jgi:hypothetical protein